MTPSLFVHTPWVQFNSRMSFLSEQGLQPEIAFKAADLDTLSSQQLVVVRRFLDDLHLTNTIHAPFMDLNPGALDSRVQEVTAQRFRQTLDAAEALGSKLVVFHPGYDSWRYGGQSHLWIEQNLRFWPEFIRRAEMLHCHIVLENIFDETPDNLQSVLNHFNSPWFGACFDIGHWRLFSETPISQWQASLRPYLRHFHLHDNFGKRDDHLPIGEGDISFQPLWETLGLLPVQPSLTLEAHDADAILRSRVALQSVGIV